VIVIAIFIALGGAFSPTLAALGSQRRKRR
jgi:hypothetical protein